jgi:hypothetical protein
MPVAIKIMLQRSARIQKQKGPAYPPALSNLCGAFLRGSSRFTLFGLHCAEDQLVNLGSYLNGFAGLDVAT